MAIIREQAVRKKRIKSGFARWAEELKPRTPVAGGPRPIGIDKPSVVTPSIQEGRPARVRQEQVATQVQAAEGMPDIIRPPEVADEEPADAPSDAPRLDERDPRELAEDLSEVIDEEAGALKFFQEATALIESAGFKGTRIDGPLHVILAIIQARSGGDEERVHGDAVGIFSMTSAERRHVEYELRKRGAIEDSKTFGPDDFNEWRFNANNQLGYYVPLILHWYRRGRMQNLQRAELAEFVGRHIEVKGGFVARENVYTQSYKDTEAMTLAWIYHTTGGKLPASFRNTVFADGKGIDGTASGLPPFEDFSYKNLPDPPPGSNIAPTYFFEGDVEYRNKGGKSVDPLYIAGQHIETGPPTGIQKLLDSLESIGWNWIEQKAGLMYQSGPRGKAQVEFIGGMYDRGVSILGGIASTISTIGAGVMIPFHAVAAMIRPGGFITGPTRYGQVMSSGTFENIKAIKARMDSEPQPDSLVEGGRKGWQHFKNRLARTGEILAPSLPDHREEEGFLKWSGRKLKEIYSADPEEKFATRTNPATDPTDRYSSHYAEYIGIALSKHRSLVDQILHPWSKNWTEEEAKLRYDEAKDFSYTWLYDAKAEEDYYKEKYYLLKHINADRANQGLPPRGLNHHETDELKMRYEDPNIQMAAEFFFDFFNFTPAPWVKGVLGVGTKYTGLSWATKQLWKQVEKIPAVKQLFAQALNSSSDKLVGDVVETGQEGIDALIRTVDGEDVLESVVNQQVNTGGGDKNVSALLWKTATGQGNFVDTGLFKSPARKANVSELGGIVIDSKPWDIGSATDKVITLSAEDGSVIWRGAVDIDGKILKDLEGLRPIGKIDNILRDYGGRPVGGPVLKRLVKTLIGGDFFEYAKMADDELLKEIDRTKEIIRDAIPRDPGKQGAQRGHWSFSSLDEEEHLKFLEEELRRRTGKGIDFQGGGHIIEEVAEQDMKIRTGLVPVADQRTLFYRFHLVGMQSKNVPLPGKTYHLPGTLKTIKIKPKPGGAVEHVLRRGLAQSFLGRMKQVENLLRYSDEVQAATAKGDPFQGILDILDDSMERAKQLLPDGVDGQQMWTELGVRRQHELIMEQFTNRLKNEFFKRHGMPVGAIVYDRHGNKIEVDGTQVDEIVGKTPMWLRRLWIEANLSARPGFTVRNVIDSTFRALVGGNGPEFLRRDIHEILENTPIAQEVLAAFAGTELGHIARKWLERKRLPRFWKFNDWIEAISDISQSASHREKLIAAGVKDLPMGTAFEVFPYPIGRKGWPFWKKIFQFDFKKFPEGAPWGKIDASYATFVEMMRDYNEAFEVMMRIRLYDQKYWKTYDSMAEFIFERIIYETPGIKKSGQELLKHVIGRRTKNPEDLMKFVSLAIDDATGQLHAAPFLPEVLQNYKLGTELLREYNVSKVVAQDFARIQKAIEDDIVKTLNAHTPHSRRGSLGAQDVIDIFRRHRHTLDESFQKVLKQLDANDSAKGSGNVGLPTDPHPKPGGGGEGKVVEETRPSVEYVLSDVSEADHAKYSGKGKGSETLHESKESYTPAYAASSEMLDHRVKDINAQTETTVKKLRTLLNSKQTKELISSGVLIVDGEDIIKRADNFLANIKQATQEINDLNRDMFVHYLPGSALQDAMVMDAAGPKDIWKNKGVVAPFRGRHTAPLTGEKTGKGVDAYKVQQRMAMVMNARINAAYQDIIDQHLFPIKILNDGIFTKEGKRRVNQIELHKHVEEIINHLDEALLKLDELKSTKGWLTAAFGEEGKGWDTLYTVLKLDEDPTAWTRFLEKLKKDDINLYNDLKKMPGRIGVHFKKPEFAKGWLGMIDFKEWVEPTSLDPVFIKSPERTVKVAGFDIPVEHEAGELDDLLSGGAIRDPENSTMGIDDFYNLGWESENSVPKPNHILHMQVIPEKPQSFKPLLALTNGRKFDPYLMTSDGYLWRGWHTATTMKLDSFKGVVTKVPVKYDHYALGYLFDEPKRKVGTPPPLKKAVEEAVEEVTSPQKALDLQDVVENGKVNPIGKATATDDLNASLVGAGQTESMLDKFPPEEQSISELQMIVSTLNHKKIIYKGQGSTPDYIARDLGHLETYAEQLTIRLEEKAIVEGMKKVPNHESGMLALQNIMKKEHTLLADTQKLVSQTGKADPVMEYHKSLILRNTASEYLTHPDSGALIPHILDDGGTTPGWGLKAEKKVRVRNYLTGATEYTAENLAKEDWKVLSTIARLNGIEWNRILFPKGAAKGIGKKDFANHIVNMQRLDNIFKDLDQIEIKSLLENGKMPDRLSDDDVMEEARALYADLFGVEYAKADPFTSLALTWESKANREIQARRYTNYLDHIGKAIQEGQILPDHVLVSALATEQRLIELFQDRELARGFSKKYSKHRSVAQEAAFDSLDFAPDELISPERLHMEGWELATVAEGVLEDVQFSVKHARARLNEVANNAVRNSEGLDAGWRYAIYREDGRIPTYRLYKKQIPPDAIPWLLSLEDFMVWLRMADEEKARKYGWQWFTDKEHARIMTVLSGRQGHKNIDNMTGLAWKDKEVINKVRKARFDILKKAVRGGKNVPTQFLLEYDALIDERNRVGKLLLSAAGPGELLGPGGGGLTRVKSTKHAIWNDLTEYNEIAAEYWADYNTKYEKLTAREKRRQLAGVVDSKGRAKLPKIVSMLMALDDVRINTGNLGELIKTRDLLVEVRSNINFKTKQWEAQRKRIKHVVDPQQAKKQATIAEAWKRAETEITNRLTLVDDKVYSLDATWHDNRNKLSKSIAAHLSDPESTLGKKVKIKDTRPDAIRPRFGDFHQILTYLKNEALETGLEPGVKAKRMRTWALSELLAGTNSRWDAMSHLSWGDLDLELGEVWLHNPKLEGQLWKGVEKNEGGAYRLQEDAIQALTKYEGFVRSVLKTAEKTDWDNRLLFTWLPGETKFKSAPKKIPTQLRSHMEKAAKDAKDASGKPILDKRELRPHDYRNYAITRFYIGQNKNLEATREFARHADTAQTLGYLLPYRDPEELGMSISKSGRALAELAPQLQVDTTYAKMLTEADVGQAKKLENWIPKKAEATESEIKQLKNSWDKLLKQQAYKNVEDQSFLEGAQLFEGTGELVKGTELYERFFREAARRVDFINHPQEGIHVIRGMLKDLEAARKLSQELVQSGLDEAATIKKVLSDQLDVLETLQPAALYDVPSLYARNEDPMYFKGYKIYNKNGTAVAGGGVFNHRADAQDAADKLNALTHIQGLHVSPELEWRITDDWRDVFGNDYDNWRRWKFFNFQEEIAEHPDYRKITNEIRARYDYYTEPGHTFGLREYHPLEGGPLSWDAYLQDLEKRSVIDVNLQNFPPERIAKPKGTKFAAAQTKSGATLKRIKDNKSLRLRDPFKINGDDVVLIAPERGYKLVPKKQYPGEVRKFTMGHVSGFEGVEVTWNKKKYVMTNDIHFHSVDDFTISAQYSTDVPTWSMEPIYGKESYNISTLASDGVDQKTVTTKIVLINIDDATPQHILATDKLGQFEMVLNPNAPTNWNIVVPKNPQVAAEAIRLNAQSININRLLEDHRIFGSGMPVIDRYGNVIDGNARINMLLMNKYSRYPGSENILNLANNLDTHHDNWLQYQKAVKDQKTLMQHGILGDNPEQNEFIMNRINSGNNWVLVKMIDEPVQQSEIMRMIRIANNPQLLDDNLDTLYKIWEKEKAFLDEVSTKINLNAGDEASWGAINVQASNIAKDVSAEVLADRLARAAFIDLLGKDNLVIAHNLANHYTRNSDVYIRTLLDEVLMQYTNLKTLPLEARMLDEILHAADMVTKARMFLPNLALEDVIETLISPNNRYHSKAMIENEVLTELMRLISRATQPNYDQNISKAIAEYIANIKRNVPAANFLDQGKHYVRFSYTDTIVDSISGLQPEEHFLNAIRNNAVPGRARIRAERIVDNQTSDIIQLGRSGDTADVTQLEGGGSALGNILVKFEDPQQKVRYQALKFGFVLDIEFVEDADKMGKFVRSMKEKSTQSPKEIWRNYNREQYQLLLETPEAMALKNVEEFDKTLLDEVFNKEGNQDLWDQKGRISPMSIGPWESIDEVSQYPGVVQESFKRWATEQVRNAWEPAEIVAFQRLRESKEVVEMLSEMGKSGEVDKFITPQTWIAFWKTIDDMLLNHGFIPETSLTEVFKHVDTGAEPVFVFSERGKILRSRLAAMLLEPEMADDIAAYTIPQNMKDMSDLTDNAEVYRKFITRQLNDINEALFNPIELLASNKGTGKTSKPFSTGWSTIPGTRKGVFVGGGIADFLLGTVRNKVDGTGIGIHFLDETEIQILNEIRGGIFGKAQEVPQLMDEPTVWHYADVIDRLMPQHERVLVSSLTEGADGKISELSEGLITTQEALLQRINDRITNAHAQLQLKLSEAQIPFDIRISSEAPIQYTKTDYLPERLLDAGTTLPAGSHTIEGNKTIAGNPNFWRNPFGDEGMFGSWGSIFNLSSKEGIGPGGPELGKKLLREAYENYNNMLDKWFITLVDPEGSMKKTMGIDPEELVLILEKLQTDVIPSLKIAKRVSMHGTSKPKDYDIGSAAKPRFASQVPSEFLELANKTDEFWESMQEAFRRDFIAEQNVDNFLEDYMKYDPNNVNNGGYRLNKMQGEIRSEYGDEGLKFFNERYQQYVDWLKSDPREWINWKRLKKGSLLPQKTLLPLEGQRTAAEFRGMPSPEDVDIIAPGFFASTANPYTHNWQNNPGLLGRLINGSNSQTYSELRQIKGAVKEVGDIMVDYGSQTNLDQIMKSIFPFWVFPTRSLSFWGQQLATNPKLLATFNKIQDMSERVAYDEGHVNSYGKPLARFKGYLNLAGTNWWYNPLSPFSVSQAVPDWRSVSYKAPDPEEPVMNKIAAYFFAYGPRLGFHLGPWWVAPLRWTKVINEEDYPKRSPVGQIDLIPEWMQRDMKTKLDGTLRMNFEHDLITPEVTWKDFLIERQVLLTALEQIDGVPESDRATREQIALAAKHAIETRPDADVNNYMKGTEEFHKEDSLWIAARKTLEKDEYFARLIGYFTGIYMKSGHDYEGELYKIRDENNILKGLIEQHAGFEKIRQEQRYNTAEGIIGATYSTVGWVTDEDGKALHGEDRWEAIQKQLALQTEMMAMVAARGQIKRVRDLQVASHPVGTPWEVLQPYYEEYSQGIESLKERFPDATKEDWKPYNKHEDTIKTYIIDQWMNKLGDTRPSYDPILQTYPEYQEKILEWETALLPKIAETQFSGFVGDMAAIGINVEQDVLDDYYEPTGEKVNMFHKLMGGTDLAAKKELLSMANGSRWNGWDTMNDDLYDAMNRVWRDNYWGGYWDYIGDAKGYARTEKELAYKEKYPGGPSDAQLLQWMNEVPEYKGKWSDGVVLAARYGEGEDRVTIEDREEQRSTKRENDGAEIYRIYGWAGPKKSKFLSTLSKNFGDDIKDALLDMMKSERRQLGDRGVWVNWDEEFFMKVYNAVYATAEILGLDEPSDSMISEWAQVEELNEDFKEHREKMYGPDWRGQEQRYFDMSPKDRAEWREQFPEDYETLESGWDLKKVYGIDYPLWQKYYDPENYKGKDPLSVEYGGIDPSKSTGTSSGMGTIGSAGGNMYHYAVGPGFLRDSYKNVSMTDLGKGAKATGPSPWPTIQISGVALDEILSGSVSDETLKYLESLKARVEPYNSWENFLDRLRKLALARGPSENISQDPVVYPWQEGYVEPSAAGTVVQQ